MGDLKNSKLILLKGFLFLILGLLASAILLMHAMSLTVASLLLVAIWAFCRFYYFAFYVIENYVDSEFRFVGLVHFVRYVLGKRGSDIERGC